MSRKFGNFVEQASELEAQDDPKKKRLNMIKRQVLQKKVQAVRQGAGDDVVDTDVIQKLGTNCLPSGLKFQKILNPTLPSTIPEKKKCDWETKVLNCDSDAVCENWANSEECKGVELTEKYCNYKGVCKFKTPN